MIRLLFLNVFIDESKRKIVGYNKEHVRYYK